jgi:hypothetical protein
MNKVKSFLKSKNFLIVAVLIVIAGLAYLPFVSQFGYFNDDWYLMYAARAKGATVFREIFSVDRPLRTLVMTPAYWLFGQNPLYYNLNAYFFRLISGISFYWLLHMLWPRQRAAIASMALLFLIYPGFLSQFNGIDYQSQMVSLAAAILSLALTLAAIQSTKRLSKFSLYLLSGLLAYLYIGLVDYFIGFELIRVAIIFLFVAQKERTIGKRIVQTIRMWLPLVVLLIPLIVWRLFFFESERAATDVGLQLGLIVQSPLTTSLRWLSTLFSDSIDVVVLAWGQPLSALLPWIWTRNLLLLGLGLSAVSAAILLVALKQVEGPEKNEDGNWKLEAVGLGLSSVIVGLIPIILVNRYVDFTFYSRYTLVSSAGAVILLVALILSVEQRILQKAMIVTLVFIASLTHFANSQSAVQITRATRDFWWQVSWRIPQLDKNTTLVANYAVGATEEDYFVWGPANLIYYPDGTNDRYVQPGVYAALLNQDTVNKALLNEGQEFDNRRTIRTYKNYRRLLVLSQPTVNSCVHVIDGEQPEYSSRENASVRIIGPYSRLWLVLANEPAATPPQIVFGPEPEHGWCYFYQKASLAQQREAWDEIQSIGAEVRSKNLAPRDAIEWMPFLQAYAQGEDIEHLKELAPKVVSDPYVSQQACQMLGSLQNLTQQVSDVINAQYCIE